MRRLSHVTFWVASTLVLAVFGSAPALAQLENAYGYAYDANNGVYSAIEGAAPQIRDGGWSYMRAAGGRSIGPNFYYVEIGWLKTASNPQLTSYWTYKDVNGFVNQGTGGVQGCCLGHNYRVLNVGSGNWQLYFNDLNNPLTTVWTGFDYVDFYASGGEVSSSANAMGVSGNWNVAYLQGGNWWCACDWQPNITHPAYHIGGIDATSWQVYGNN